MKKSSLYITFIFAVVLLSTAFVAVQPILLNDKVEMYLYFKNVDGEALSDAIVYMRVLPTPGSESKVFRVFKTGEKGRIHVTLSKGELFRDWRVFIKEKFSQLKITPFKVSLMIDAVKFDGEYIYAIDGASIVFDPLKTSYEKKVAYFYVNYVEKVNVSLYTSLFSVQSSQRENNGFKPNIPIYEEVLVDYREWSGVEVPILGFKADDNGVGDSTYDSDTFYGRVGVSVKTISGKCFQIGLSVLSYQSNSWSYSIGGNSYNEYRSDDLSQDFSTQSGSQVTHGYISFANCYIRWEKYVTYVGGSPVREKHKVYLEYISHGPYNNLLNVHKNEYPSWLTNFAKSSEAIYQGTGDYNNQWNVDDPSNPNKIIIMNLLAQTSISYGFTPIGYIIQVATGAIPFPIDLGITWTEDYTVDLRTGIAFDAGSNTLIKVYLYSTGIEYNVEGFHYNLQLTFLDFDEVFTS